MTPFLAHMFQDSADDDGSAAVTGAAQDTLRENPVPTPTKDPGVEDPLENARALTQRELEVLYLVSLGWATPRIADELELSYHTVRNHIRHSRLKLGAATKLDAVLTAIRQGMLHFPQDRSTTRTKHRHRHQ